MGKTTLWSLACVLGAIVSGGISVVFAALFFLKACRKRWPRVVPGCGQPHDV